VIREILPICGNGAGANKGVAMTPEAMLKTILCVFALELSLSASHRKEKH
jgi:hypothetical protein